MSTPVVIVDEKAKENGLAVMLADLLTQNMEQHPGKVRFFERLKTTVAITARDAGVKLTMFFNRGSCVIYDGVVGNPDLHIVADSESILGLSTVPLQLGMPNILDRAGRRLINKIFSGQIKIHGMLLHPIRLVYLTNIFSVN